MKLRLREFAFLWGTHTAALCLGSALCLDLCNAIGPLQSCVKPAESWGLLCSTLVTQIKDQSLEAISDCRLREINGTTSQKMGEMEGYAEQYLYTYGNPQRNLLLMNKLKNICVNILCWT